MKLDSCPRELGVRWKRPWTNVRAGRVASAEEGEGEDPVKWDRSGLLRGRSVVLVLEACQRRWMQSSTRAMRPVATITLEEESC